MSDANNASSMEALKNELSSLRNQIENLVKAADAKGHQSADDLASRIVQELNSYKRRASEQADRLRDAGSAGLEEVGNQVRQNPLASLLIAFGAGCVVSCLFRHLR